MTVSHLHNLHNTLRQLSLFHDISNLRVDDKSIADDAISRTLDEKSMDIDASSDSFSSESEMPLVKACSNMSILSQKDVSNHYSSSKSLNLLRSAFHSNLLTQSNRQETTSKARTLFRAESVMSKLNTSLDFTRDNRRQAISHLDLSEANESLCEKQLPALNTRQGLHQNKYLRQVRNDSMLMEDAVSKCSDKNLFQSPLPDKVYTRTKILPNGDLVFILPPTLTTSTIHGVSNEDLNNQHMWRPW